MVGKTTGVARRWRWTVDEARAALEELKATGESAASFARRKGISSRRVAYWRKRLLASTSSTDFVPVALPAVSPARIEIAMGVVVVRVREELDVEHVARLVEAIGRRMGRAC